MILPFKILSCDGLIYSRAWLPNLASLRPFFLESELLLSLLRYLLFTCASRFFILIDMDSWYTDKLFDELGECDPCWCWFLLCYPLWLLWLIWLLRLGTPAPVYCVIDTRLNRDAGVNLPSPNLLSIVPVIINCYWCWCLGDDTRIWWAGIVACYYYRLSAMIML